MLQLPDVFCVTMGIIEDSTTQSPTKTIRKPNPSPTTDDSFLAASCSAKSQHGESKSTMS
jgi:hypothetical protein